MSNLVRSTNTLSWDPPFSLDLTNIDPDIVYCVEVYNITCGRSLLISECDVMETSYTNNTLHSRYIYEYTVTPRSDVDGARNETSPTEIGGIKNSVLITFHNIVCGYDSTHCMNYCRGICKVKTIF